MKPIVSIAFFLMMCIVFYGIFKTNRTIDQVNNPDIYDVLPNGGTVLQSTIVKSYSYKHCSYKPVIVYEYTVDGKKYISDLVSPNVPEPPMAIKYPVGAKVDIIYKKDDPHTAYLERGIKFGLELPTIFLVLFMVILFNNLRKN